MSNPTDVHTFVFIDIETTDHPKNTILRTKITELSMVAVSEHQLKPKSTQRPHKLTLCFNPFRFIEPGATGLTNELLEHENEFNTLTCEAIAAFLSCLKKPVCLIAHNGDKYDFPILRKYFAKHNVELDSELLCTDSLKCFRELNTESSGHKLKDIYMRNVNGDDFEAHQAENDCIMTMKVAAEYGQQFIEWVKNGVTNGNCRKFSDVECLSAKFLLKIDDS